MNAVIYARYSSHGQTEQSIEGQLRACHDYAEREGLTIVGEYIDRALTGRSDDRPDFQRMIEDSKKRNFQRVIVWKLDRFARNRYDSAIYKAKLKKHDVRVISATENIGDNPDGILLEGILESMAEHYSANLSVNVKRGLRESVIKGTYTGGIPPIGYRVVDKKLVIDEEKAPIIKFAFEQYAKGVPKRQIIDELNAKGVRNYYGRPLTLSCFQHALHNKKYIGKYIFNGQEVTGGCPAIIDEDTFDKVQDRLTKVKHAPAATKARQEYLLQGKAFCGMCGARMVGDGGTSKSGKVHYYYACGEKKKAHTCQKRNEKKDFLEWYVVEQTVEYVLTPERLDYIAERVVQEYEKDFNDSNVRTLERRIAKLEKDINKAVDDFMSTDSKPMKKRLEEKVERLEAQKADLEVDLSKLKIATRIQLTKEQIINWLKAFCNGDPLDMDFRRRIIDVLINSVYLFDDKLVIFYNVKDGKQTSYIEPCEDWDEIGEPPDISGGAGVQISNETPRH